MVAFTFTGNEISTAIDGTAVVFKFTAGRYETDDDKQITCLRELSRELDGLEEDKTQKPAKTTRAATPAEEGE